MRRRSKNCFLRLALGILLCEVLNLAACQSGGNSIEASAISPTATTLPTDTPTPTILPTATSTATPFAISTLALPRAPTDLKAFTQCYNWQWNWQIRIDITLRWSSGANNEMGYHIYKNGYLIESVNSNTLEYFELQTTRRRSMNISDVYAVSAWNQAGESEKTEIRVEFECRR